MSYIEREESRIVKVKGACTTHDCDVKGGSSSI